MISAADIVSRVRTKYESESSVRWTDARILAAINEGLDDLSLEAGFYERTVVVPVVAGQTYYDLRGFTPETPLSITAVYSTSLGDWMWEATGEELDRYNPCWEESTGTPVKFFTRGIYWLGVWPCPDATSGYMRVYFKGLAPHFLHDQSVLDDLPDDAIPALEDYALYDMAAQDGMTERALRYFETYKEKKEGLMHFMDRRMSRSGTMHMGEAR